MPRKGYRKNDHHASHSAVGSICYTNGVCRLTVLYSSALKMCRLSPDIRGSALHREFLSDISCVCRLSLVRLDVCVLTAIDCACSPMVYGNTVHATFTPSPSDAKVTNNLLRFMFEGEPECGMKLAIHRNSYFYGAETNPSVRCQFGCAVLYNGVGGPDNSTAIAASPFFVSLAGGKSVPALMPATPCASMLSNGSCYYLPAPCSSFTRILPNGTHVRPHLYLRCGLVVAPVSTEPGLC